MPTLPKTTKRPWMADVAKQSGRKVDNSSFYNSRRWRKISKEFLRCSPLCVDCRNEERVVMATITDHIVPITQGGDHWDWSNLQSLCDKHHAIKSGREAHQQNNYNQTNQ
jgi:5-methylcytosine-specific restriction endonuclease McrA